MAECPRNAFPRRPTVTRFSRDAFPGALPWLDFAAVRSRAAIRGRFCAPCIPKASSDGKIASSRQDSHATHPKTGWLWQDLRAMHPKCPANSRLGIHRAKILPGRGTFRCTGPSNHARRANLAIRRRRSTLAPATSVPPNSASRPQSQHRPHGAAALGTRHPAQRQTALAPATPRRPRAPAAPKRNSGANRAVNDPAPRISGSAQHCSGERVRGAARRRSASR